MERIKGFSEIAIRNAILNKASLCKINKNGKHWKGYIEINGKVAGKVKIPNEHQRIMYGNKSMYIAQDLKLSEVQFNNFVICSMSSDEYKEIISQFV
jgi:hypothetical protein